MENGEFMGISEEGRIVRETELKDLRKRYQLLEQLLRMKAEELEIS